jgi:multidrug efflux pump
MTSLSTVLGILPLHWRWCHSESRVSMGIAVVGGLILSSFLTLFIVPAIYSFFSRKTASVTNVTD